MRRYAALVAALALAGCGLHGTAKRKVDREDHAPTPAPLLTVEPTPSGDVRADGLPRASRGTPRPATTPSRRHHRLATTRLLHGDVTAYCVRGQMANGDQVHVGAVATLDRGLAFGTRLRIAGRVYVVADRIGHGSSFDLWMPSCAAARAWGRHHLTVEVVR